MKNIALTTIFAIGLLSGSAFAQKSSFQSIPQSYLPAVENTWYKNIPLDSKESKNMWGDMLNMDGGQSIVPPKLFATEMTDRFGRTVTIAFFTSRVNCNLNKCGLRIFVNGVLDSDNMACSNIKTHKMSSDGTYFMACDEKFNVTAP